MRVGISGGMDPRTEEDMGSHRPVGMDPRTEEDTASHSPGGTDPRTGEDMGSHSPGGTDPHTRYYRGPRTVEKEPSAHKSGVAGRAVCTDAGKTSSCDGGNPERERGSQRLQDTKHKTLCYKFPASDDTRATWATHQEK